MAKGRVRLTRRLVEGISPGKKDVFVWDDQVLGFGLRVRPGGHRGYVLQYRHGGQTRRFQIGAHGSPWTVETARSRALQLLGQVAEGRDPQETKRLDREALTLGELCDLYLAEGLATRKASSVASARSDIENHIKPLLGSKRASLVNREDVDRLLMAVAEGQTARRAKTKSRGLSRVRGGRGAANAAVVTLSAAFGFAVARRIRIDNPAWRVRRFPEKKIDRFLSPIELGRLGEAIVAAEAIGVESPVALAALKLLILTGCRRGEILTAKWEYLDRHHRCLRLPDSKTGAKVVHLGAAALKVIEGLTPAPGNPYLLPGPGADGRLVNLQKPWTRIRAAADLNEVRIHDLRHAFASLGVASGDSLYVVGALLGHRSPKTTARYAHLADHPVKGAADRISQEMAELIGAEMGDPFPGDDARQAAERAARDEAAQARALSVIGEVRRARWLSTIEAAALLGSTKGTLQTWRWAGVGPAYRKIGRRVVYAEGTVRAWAAQQDIPLPCPVLETVRGDPKVVSLASRRRAVRD